MHDEYYVTFFNGRAETIRYSNWRDALYIATGLSSNFAIWRYNAVTGSTVLILRFNLGGIQ